MEPGNVVVAVRDVWVFFLGSQRGKMIQQGEVALVIGRGLAGPNMTCWTMIINGKLAEFDCNVGHEPICWHRLEDLAP